MSWQRVGKLKKLRQLIKTKNESDTWQGWARQRVVSACGRLLCFSPPWEGASTASRSILPSAAWSLEPAFGGSAPGRAEPRSPPDACARPVVPRTKVSEAGPPSTARGWIRSYPHRLPGLAAGIRESDYLSDSALFFPLGSVDFKSRFISLLTSTTGPWLRVRIHLRPGCEHESPPNDGIS